MQSNDGLYLAAPIIKCYAKKQFYHFEKEMAKIRALPLVDAKLTSRRAVFCIIVSLKASYMYMLIYMISIFSYIIIVLVRN